MSAQLTIVLFFLTLTGVLFYFSQSSKLYVSNLYGDLLIKRTLFMVSVYMMSMTAGVVLQIASAPYIVEGAAEYTLSAVNHEIVTMIAILNWAGYVVMVYTAVRTVFDLMKLNQEMVAGKRGYD